MRKLHCARHVMEALELAWAARLRDSAAGPGRVRGVWPRVRVCARRRHGVGQRSCRRGVTTLHRYTRWCLYGFSFEINSTDGAVGTRISRLRGASGRLYVTCTTALLSYYTMLRLCALTGAGGRSPPTGIPRGLVAPECLLSTTGPPMGKSDRATEYAPNHVRRGAGVGRARRGCRPACSVYLSFHFGCEHPLERQFRQHSVADGATVAGLVHGCGLAPHPTPPALPLLCPVQSAYSATG